MPKGLKRRYGEGHLHFITFTCYRRRKLLATARARNVFAQILDEVRCRYKFQLVGYVVMPEHVHLLISEPPACNPSTVIQVLKQRVSRRLRGKKRRRCRLSASASTCTLQNSRTRKKKAALVRLPLPPFGADKSCGGFAGRRAHE
jgi:REP element-mobilizing transposase RayT